MKTVFLTCFLATLSAVADDTSTPDFSNYPQSKKFSYFVEAHRSGDFPFERNSGGNPAVSAPLLLAISRFTSDDGDSALDYLVTTSGYETDCREMPYWATQASWSKQLTAGQLAQLKVAIGNLPKTNTYPPLPQLVIVSFRQGDAWVTRTCRPEDVRAIHDIIGERKETADTTK